MTTCEVCAVFLWSLPGQSVSKREQNRLCPLCFVPREYGVLIALWKHTPLQSGIPPSCACSPMARHCSPMADLAHHDRGYASAPSVALCLPLPCPDSPPIASTNRTTTTFPFFVLRLQECSPTFSSALCDLSALPTANGAITYFFTAVSCRALQSNPPSTVNTPLGNSCPAGLRHCLFSAAFQAVDP
ncbi:hypothetical protein F4780DRAFT_561868 [Xylariomycetidae sp. FL0641]|nr:hypothetical protein F4780DRAFT_561868 [Xylariomycetidae sp. FL0641]